MKVKGIVILSLCLLSLIGFAIYDHLRESGLEKTKMLESRLVEMDPEAVTGLSVDNQHGVVELQKVDGQWSLVAPLREISDQNEIRQIILTVASERIVEVAKEGEIDWTLYGLDKPLGTLKLQSGESQIQFTVGGIPNFEGNLYLRRNQEERVLVVQPSFSTYVSYQLKDLRDRRIFKGDLAKITELKISNKQGRLVLKNQDGVWTADKGVELEQNSVRDLLTKLGGLRAKDILDKAVKAPEKVLDFEVQTSEGPWKAQLGRSRDRKIIATLSGDKKIYHMDEGLVAHFEELTLESLKKQSQEDSAKNLEQESMDEN